jgi:hypothetical protein
VCAESYVGHVLGFIYMYMRQKYKQDYKAVLFTMADPSHYQEEDLVKVRSLC